MKKRIPAPGSIYGVGWPPYTTMPGNIFYPGTLYAQEQFLSSRAFRSPLFPCASGGKEKEGYDSCPGRRRYPCPKARLRLVGGLRGRQAHSLGLDGIFLPSCARGLAAPAGIPAGAGRTGIPAGSGSACAPARCTRRIRRPGPDAREENHPLSLPFGERIF